jgi:hypothetical protein
MATKVVRDDNPASAGKCASRPDASKSYRSPSLVKGPTLSAVTAELALSGGNILDGGLPPVECLIGGVIVDLYR